MNLRRVDPASSPIENSPGRKTQLDNLPSPPPQFLEEKTYLVKTWTMWGGGGGGVPRVRKDSCLSANLIHGKISFLPHFVLFHHHSNSSTTKIEN